MTQTHWNGYLFWGLQPRTVAGAGKERES
ncbi:MAG: DUF2924 domain-containing protein [Proteobacteria bacterium]|nr:DUF2924 domain-containing protein [Pseudomonadota bacterium]